ncbi:unnamed protein product [Cylicostephanus goldi]|uniref:SET domain-containing protein n=1 Tax=Cylicostephanus goldi TaxID=71465 RepID=A0A3P6S1Z1_CYLGO|nr:unnamed protein product [Cylicostephanus goldi]
MLVASEKIEKGTEVTIPFDCDFRDTVVPVDCACGEDPNCYMKQFNNSLRAKNSVEERPNHDVPQEDQQPNGMGSTRKVVMSTTPKIKSESRGRPKGSGKKEKAADETPKKKGAPGRKPKKVGIRLRRHSESKSAKSPESPKEQSAVSEASDVKDESTDMQKSEQAATTPADAGADVSVSAENNKAEEVKEEAAATPGKQDKKTSETEKKAEVTSPKKNILVNGSVICIEKVDWCFSILTQ